MKIIFIGQDENAAYCCNQVIKQSDQLKIIKTNSILESKDEVMRLKPDVIIASVLDFEDEEEDIANTLHQLSRALNAQVIIYSPKSVDESRELISLQSLGFNMIITSSLQGEMKDQLKAFLEHPLSMNGIYEGNASTERLISGREESEARYLQMLNNDFSDINNAGVDQESGRRQDETFRNIDARYSNNTQMAQNTADPYERFNSAIPQGIPPELQNGVMPQMQQSENNASTMNFAAEPHYTQRDLESTPNIYQTQPAAKIPSEYALKIAVVGSMQRIGTTTVSLQFVKYLNSLSEHNAAYIEFNNSGFVKSTYNTFQKTSYDDGMSRIKYSDVDMYYDPAKIHKVLSSGYGYVVYDYGAINKVNDISSLLDKDIIVIVGGVKADEMAAMTLSIKQFYRQNNAFYVFNFVPPTQFNALKDLQAQLASKTYICSYAPDPFTLAANNANIFKSILASDYQREDITHGENKRAERLFRRRG